MKAKGPSALASSMTAAGLALVVMSLTCSAAMGAEIVSAELIQGAEGAELDGSVPMSSRAIVRLWIAEDQLEAARSVFPSIAAPGPFETTMRPDSLDVLEELGIEFAVAGTQLTARDIDLGGSGRLRTDDDPPGSGPESRFYSYGTNDTNVNIPDLGTVHTFIDITDAPAGATVTSVEYDLRVVHDSVWDLVLSLENSERLVDVWYLEGGYTDEGADDDPEDDHDIEFWWRVEATAFDGDFVNDTWGLQVEDLWEEPGYEGYIDYLSLRIYYDLDLIDTPVLLSPDDFEECVSTSVVLSWTEVSGTGDVTYQLRVGEGCGNGSVHTTSALSLQVSGLDYCTVYDWQVRAGDIFGWSLWSDCFCFETTPDPDAIANLQLPPDQAQGVPTAVTLDWASVPGAQSYDVQVGTSCGAGSVYSPSASEYDVSGLESGTIYYWRVRAYMECGITGDWTDCFTFETEGTGQLVIGGLSIDGELIEDLGGGLFRVTDSVFVGDENGLYFPFFLGSTSEVLVDLNAGTVDVVVSSNLELHHLGQEFEMSAGGMINIDPSVSDPDEASIAFHGSLHGATGFTDFGISGDLTLKTNQRLLDIESAAFFGVDEVFPSNTLAEFHGMVDLSGDCMRFLSDTAVENTAEILVLSPMMTLPYDNESDFRFRVKLDLTNKIFEILLNWSLLEVDGSGGSFGLGCFPLQVCGGFELDWDEGEIIPAVTIVDALNIGIGLTSGRSGPVLLDDLGRETPLGTEPLTINNDSADWAAVAGDGREDPDDGGRFVIPVGIGIELKGREIYEDENCNGVYDYGEPFEDTVVEDGVWTDGARFWLDDADQLNMHANARLFIDLLFYIHLQVAQAELTLDWGQEYFETDLSNELMMGPEEAPWFVVGGGDIPDAHFRFSWGEPGQHIHSHSTIRPLGISPFWEIETTFEAAWEDETFQELSGEFLSELVLLDFLTYELQNAQFYVGQDGLAFESDLSFPLFNVGTSVVWREDLFRGHFTAGFELIGFELLAVDSAFSITPDCLHIDATVLFPGGIEVPMGFLWCDGDPFPDVTAGVSFVLACPADLHFYDAEGRHIGRDPVTGEIEIGIPGGVYLESVDGEAKYISVPDLDLSTDNQLVVDSQGTGEFALDVLYPDPGAGYANHATYTGLPLEMETRAELTISEVEDFTLRVDLDGDGTDDLFAQPDTLSQPGIDPTLIRITHVGAHREGDVTDMAAEVTWETNVPATSTVYYGLGTSYGDTVSGDGYLITDHSVTLVGLEPDST